MAEGSSRPPSAPAGEAPRAVRARSWCRVDLAGGTLDIWPLGLLHPGARTVNLAIDMAVTVSVERSSAGYEVHQGDRLRRAAEVAALGAHPDTALVAAVVMALDLPPVSIHLESASPRGGGLGASSAMIVALLAAGQEFLGRPHDPPARLAALGRDLEARMMSLPTGVQDHYPGLLGGVLEILYRPGEEVVERLPVDLEALGESLVVAYTGRSHFSAGQNWDVVRRRLDGEPETVELFSGIAAAATGMAAALRAGDLAEAGEQMAREWSFRRRLAPGVSTETIEELLERGREAGAWGGKACGAGGGGSIALLCPPDRRVAVSEALAAVAGAGVEILAARPTSRRLEIERPADGAA